MTNSDQLVLDKKNIDTILVLDFGSQYTQLIARRIRELDVFSIILPWDISKERILEINPTGIILSGGPQEAEQGHRGGFNLKASDGDFSSKDSATYITENGEVTHDHSGANQRTWDLEWKAPYSDEDVRFTIAGNVVDGDHQPTDGDDWSLESYTSYGSKLSLSDQILQYSDILIMMFLFGIPLVLLYRKKS